MTGKRNHPSSPSILLIGASGLAGHEIVNHLIEHDSKPRVHLFCEKSASQLHHRHQEACASIYHGDSSRATDVLAALQETGATIVILSIDNRDKKSDLCAEKISWACVSAMKMPGMDHIRAIVLSSAGAGTSRIKTRLGYGRIMERRRRSSIKDHSAQESAFRVNGLDDRTVIIRTTDLTNGNASGEIVEYGDKEKAPSFSVDRADVAQYVCKHVCNTNDNLHGKIVNITGRRPE